MTSASDQTFLALPQYVQRRIDRAFDSIVNPNARSTPRDLSRKAVAVSDPTQGIGGGFLIDNDDSTSGNGFAVEEGEEDNSASDIHLHIPMSSIPSALQLLDLPPDDDQVLSVFRNAASGWSSSSSYPTEKSADNGGMVSKEDWRAVCAVLFEHHAEEYDDSEDGGVQRYAGQDTSDAGVDSDEYHELEPSSDDSGGGSDDEYVEGPSRAPARRRPHGAPRSRSTLDPDSPSSSTPKQLTPRQKQTCLQAFALFFPSVAASELPNQKIMIKDIQRVAKVLGEKIKPEEMVDMVESFSTLPDKSMSLADFERMMIAARLA